MPDFIFSPPKKAIATGYRAACWIDPIDSTIGGNDGVVTVESGGDVDPGTDAIVRIRFLWPDLVQGKAQPGVTFEIREGLRIVGRATVIASDAR